MRHAEFMALLNIFKGTVNMIENSLEKCKMQEVMLLDFNSKFKLGAFLNLKSSGNYGDVY